jgi:hypothetical protein
VVSTELMLTESTKNRRAAVDNSGLGHDVATSVRRGFVLLLIATLVASLMAGLVADTADAKKHKKKKKLQTSTSTVNFGPITINSPLSEPVTIKNNTGKTVTFQPTVVGEGFTLVEEDAITLEDGEEALLNVELLSALLGDKVGELTLVDIGTNEPLELVDKTTGKTVEKIDLIGTVVDLLE